jgi:uncharacterized Fe-S cluster-containing radical SAM superfamily protein
MLFPKTDHNPASETIINGVAHEIDELLEKMAYDSIRRHQAIEKLVTRHGFEGEERKYYRFRPARWYGGVVTADCVGCGLLCRFCWVRDSVMLHPAEVGRFYTPTEVADHMVALAEKTHFSQLRVSGGEPTMGKTHLLKLLDALRGRGFSFILETNGIPIAYDVDYAKDLSKYDFLHVRVSLKGCNEEEFSSLTGARPQGFRLQLVSLEKLEQEGVSCHPAIMTSFSSRNNLQALIERFKKISADLSERAEVEELILYPHVIERIRRCGLKYTSAYKPTRVPQERV